MIRADAASHLVDLKIWTLILVGLNVDIYEME